MRRHDDKNKYINWALKSKSGMVIGKFLIPEFCKEINFTIEDLSKLSPLIEILDEKHDYERIIFESYLNNKAFVLTREQRDAAYASYCASR